MTIHLKLIYRLSVIFVKIPADFFAEIDKLVQKFLGKWKGLILTKTILEKKHKTGGITPSYFKTYCQVIVSK